MAIGSAAIPFNIDFVLDNLSIRHYFKAIVSANDVTVSKPHPETFLKAAAQLHETPASCLVFEDAPKGVESAFNAGMKCVVLTTMHSEEEFRHYPNIVSYIADYTDPSIDELFE
jgi:beta-phosphoglucomutase-like phosphatase (HAD superfamily)